MLKVVFSIFKQINIFKFRFQIKLHCDDRSILEYIKNRLKIGNVYPLNQDTKIDYVRWIVISKNDLLKLIEIFNKNNFNTTKHLVYLAWREDFLLYNQVKKEQGDNSWIRKIENLKIYHEW
jgi:hypothetical protein